MILRFWSPSNQFNVSAVRMDGKFWGALAADVAGWDAAYSVQAAHNRANNGRLVTRDESLVLMLKARGLKAVTERAFFDIMQRCSTVLAANPSITAADLEKELRSKDVPVYILAEAMDPKGPEVAAGMRVVRHGQPTPYLVNFVVTRNPSYLLSERRRAIKSCLKSPSLCTNQRQRAEKSLTESKDPSGLIALNLELLQGAGFRMAPDPKEANTDRMVQSQQLVDELRRQNVRGLMSVPEIRAAAHAGDLLNPAP